MVAIHRGGNRWIIKVGFIPARSIGYERGEEWSGSGGHGGELE